MQKADQQTALASGEANVTQSLLQAVNAVTASGAMYFSSASNSGNKDDGTSGTWEGDFSDGGQTISPLEAGRIHSFGVANYDACLGSGPGGSELRADLFWSDPLGASTNDYDLYVLDSTGSSVVASSTNPQNGTQDPYENVGTLSSGERIVIVKWSGAGRFLHLSTGRGLLSVNTQGSTRGHDCATNAFNVAATYAKNSYPNPFTGGAVNPVETFSSDGTRRVFFQADGTPITAGNFSSSGGAVRQKPDITAADAVTTDIPGFEPFAGTSAAAPHAAAIAALLKSYNQTLTPSQIRTILTNTALNIMSAGVDRDSGAGIVMALPALQQSPVPTPITAPASIVGKAMGGIITSGDYPFVASGGYFLLIPANSGNTYQLVEVDDESGVYSILTASGTYSYAASGSTGLFQLVEGSDTLKGSLNFDTTNIGTYLLTNVSVAPIVASQTGEYELFQTPALNSIAGKTFRCFIQDGISPYFTTGTFDFKVAASGAGYAIVDSETGITNSTGTYSYSKPNSSTGQVQLNDSGVGTETGYFAFSSAIEGEFLATQLSSGGFQIGHFVLVDTTKPNLTIQFPTAGARLTNALITAQGTATDVRVEPGKFATDRNHVHSPYRRVVEHGQAYLLDRARLIGAHTGSWAEAMVQQRGPIGTRVLHGLLSLAQKHPVKALESATEKALHHGTWRLRDLRTLLEQAGPAPQLDFLETHPLIRNLDTYRDCVPDCFSPATINPEPAIAP